MIKLEERFYKIKFIGWKLLADGGFLHRLIDRSLMFNKLKDQLKLKTEVL